MRSNMCILRKFVNDSYIHHPARTVVQIASMHHQQRYSPSYQLKQEMDAKDQTMQPMPIYFAKYLSGKSSRHQYGYGRSAAVASLYIGLLVMVSLPATSYSANVATTTGGATTTTTATGKGDLGGALKRNFGGVERQLLLPRQLQQSIPTSM